MKVIIVLLIVVTCTLSVSGCIHQEGTITESETESEFSQETLKGVSLSPKSFESADFVQFFEKAQQAGEIIMWAGDWNELTVDNGGPRVITELASTYEYTPLVEVQFFTQSSGQLLRPLNEETKNQYVTSAVAFCEKYKPPYIGFGIETNVLYMKSPDDFYEFVEFYSKVYDAVKVTSPETQVFTVFQLERMKGLNGGIFGGVNDPDEAHWFLLDLVPSDITVFTTYPGLIYTDPSEIPADYYTEIASHTKKRVAFTEIGWHSAAYPPGYESSEAEQAAFVETFFELTKDVDLELCIWSFLYDQDIIEPFNTMGLYDTNGNAKQAWNTWIRTSWRY